MRVGRPFDAPASRSAIVDTKALLAVTVAVDRAFLAAPRSGRTMPDLAESMILLHSQADCKAPAAGDETGTDDRELLAYWLDTQGRPVRHVDRNELGSVGDIDESNPAARRRLASGESEEAAEARQARRNLSLPQYR
jgi:hypothetical protein